ncbi:MAG: alpha/beta fold hydrolase [Angelakisella sp.]
MEQNLSKTPIKWRASAIVLAICLVLMVVTSVIGHNIQTSGGTVRTEELTFTTDVGATSHAKLYIPETATAETPAPAILLCHGYTASLDAMESNAIELSRRGYVVMALDMYGHGESTLPLTDTSRRKWAMWKITLPISAATPPCSSSKITTLSI